MSRTSRIATVAGTAAVLAAMMGTTPASAFTQQEYIAFVSATAQRVHQEFDLPASVAVGQSAHESRWGNSGLATSHKNYFGIKCVNPSSPGPIAIGCKNMNTEECQPTCGPTTAYFRVYRSMEDSFRDWGRMITTSSNYASALPYRHDPDAFIREVAKRYATDNNDYAGKVIRIMQQYNLYQLDNGAPPARKKHVDMDFSGDGSADLVSTTTGGELRYFPNNAGSNAEGRPFEGYKVTGTGWETADRILEADLSGDGAADLL
ncbi:glucosaminidase domain-containing protein, partial [Lentzea flava]